MASSSLEASVEAKLEALGGDQWRATQPFTIFRVPAYVRESNRAAYEPRVVSIGPYYHGDAALRAMEDHKWRYLRDVLHRRCVTVVTASDLIQELRVLEVRARDCYSERPRDDMDADDFVRMLLLDGCFILEFFFKWEKKEPDQLCDVGWGLTLVVVDLLLMENQIPFFVVEKLYDIVTGTQGSRQKLLNLLVKYIDAEEPITRPSGDWEVHHLLHLYYECFVPKRPPAPAMRNGFGLTLDTRWGVMEIPAIKNDNMKRPPPTASAPATRIILRATERSEPGVTVVRESAAIKIDGMKRLSPAAAPATRTILRASELREAGVTLVRGSAARNMFEVTFDRRKGVMEIPAIKIDDMKRPLLVNLLAFEQTLGGEEARLLASYVALMGQIIVTARDVELLRRRGILKSLLADDDEAARFFSHLGDGSAMNYNRQAFSDLYKDVHRYCDRWWPRYKAMLRRDYFASPWSVISFVVAALVVFLAATQAYFTVFPTKK
ncbi:hypothetical protein GUJ93_ZPchr0008g14128 [Zizania palustris]|uniref:Uncharacterized protein n=1 Tax=Zizania palustris TaxID=103762 RepID=A0A8J5V3F0_ZIZPA|nr:hypothetical protein GUJ93_ZPchr0008g14128 [Zizania palustris]